MSDFNRSLRFYRRPSPVLPEHRPLYKIGQLVLILYLSSRGGKSKLVRLHLFNWALKNQDRQVQIIQDLNEGVLSVEAWGFDPVLSIAIRFAKGEGLIEEVPEGCRLSDSGFIFAKALMDEQQIFIQEKKFLRSVEKKITEGMVDSASSGWGKE